MARTQKDRIIQVVVGISLNGKITDKVGNFQKHSSPEDLAFLRKKIKESDVLVMGRKTFEKHMKRIRSKPLIVFSKKDRRFFSGTKNDFLKLLNRFDYCTATVLGGAEIYHWFIQQGLVTDLFITVEPYIFGAGKNFLEGFFFVPMPSFHLVSVKHLNEYGTVLFHYRS